MMTFIIKNLPILIVIIPLMFSLIVAVLSNNRLAWALSTFASFLTMIFSISSRIGMIAFAFSLPFFALWVGSINLLPGFHSSLNSLINFFPVKLLLIFWFFIFNHHLLNGFKYFVWSYALGLDLNRVYLTTYLILILNVFMTICFSWIILS